MTMLGPSPKEGPPGVDELVEVLEEPLAPSENTTQFVTGLSGV